MIEYLQSLPNWQAVVANIALFGGMAVGVVLVIIAPVFAFLLPDTLLDRYLKQPWFNAGECILYRHFPGRVAFFINVMRSICFPKFGTKARPNMSDIHEHVHIWIKISSWVLLANLGLAMLSIFVQLAIALPTLLS